MAVRCTLAFLCLLLGAPAGASAANADVAVTMTGPQFTVVDTETAYVVTIANTGPAAAPNVVLSDVIPTGARLVRTAGDGACTPGTTLRCTFASIAVGGRAAVTIVLAAGPAGATLHHTVAATLPAATTDPTPADHSAFVDTVITAPSVAPPPIVLTGPPCANVQRGTRDDDVLTGTVFGDTLYGLDGSDLLRGSDGADCLRGGEGPDVLDGDGGDDQLWGGNGPDHLVGGAGNDRLLGGLKNDSLSGGSGDDQIVPGSGRDRVRAGAGNDVVAARDGSRDVVDCGPGVDRVVADRRDRLRGCEQVVRSRSARARGRGQ
jgi:uncharacterized repeat protein (TIGR01451 family)